MQIPEMWVELLASIQAVAPEAFIAGGALRDLDNGRPVKDIDIFIGHDDVVAHNVAGRLFGLGYTTGAYNNLEYANGADPAMIDAREYEKPGCRTINLVRLCSDVEFPAALDRFDLGLCQIGWDGEEIVRTAAYNEDAASKTMTVSRCLSADQMVRTKARYERLSEKYPGWFLVVPDRFSEFAFA